MKNRTFRRYIGTALLFTSFLCFAPVGALGANLIVAVGDSFTHEVTANVPCSTPFLTPINACPDGTGYLTVVARNLPAPTAFQNMSFAAAHTVSAPLYQIPMMSPAATVVVLFIGNNDRQPVAYGSYPMAQWKEDYDWAVEAVHERAPHARLILATLPNPAYVPFFTRGLQNNRLSAEQRTIVGNATLEMDRFIQAHDLDIADLLCEPALYDEGTLDGDKFHPNDVGFSRIAARILKILASPVTARAVTPCPPYSDPT